MGIKTMEKTSLKYVMEVFMDALKKRCDDWNCSMLSLDDIRDILEKDVINIEEK